MGPYEVLGELGRGGMGAVYRARKIGAPGREVALKVLLAPLAGVEERRRFELEAQALGSLRHPGIIPIHDTGVSADGSPYLVLALLPGGSLQDQLAQGVPLEPRRAAAIALGIARAVAAAHRQGVLHRDLKPHNVLFDAEGEPVVADFGLARMTRRDERLTETGEVLGTPAYMAPEQANGQRALIGTATDVYGVGAILYAMLSGRPPFRGGSLFALLNQVLNRSPDPLPEVDQELAAICLRCLAKDPQRRYPDAASLGAALEGWLGAERGASTGRSSVGAVVGGAALLVVGVGLVIAASLSPKESTQPSAEGSKIEERQPPSPKKTAVGPGPGEPERAQKVALLRVDFNRALKAENWSRALELAEQAVRLDRSWQTLSARAQPLWFMGRQEEALVVLKEAIQLAPEAVEIRLTFARLLDSSGRRAAALRELDRVWNLDPGKLKVQDQILLARFRLEKCRFADALPVLESVLRERPSLGEFRLSRSGALWMLWRRKDALAALRALIQAQPDSDLAARGRANLRKLEHALRETERRRPSPELQELTATAWAHAEQGRFDLALQVCQEAIRLGRSPGVLTCMSELLSGRGALKRARALGKEAFRFSSSPKEAARAAWAVARTHVLSGKDREAEPFLCQAIDLDPTLSPAFSTRSVLRFDWGLYPEAYADAQRVLELDPKDPFAQVIRGWELWHKGDYEGSLKQHDQVIQAYKDRDVSAAQEGRAAALAKLGRERTAEQEASALLQTFPKRFRMRFLKAELLWKRGRRAEALEEQRLGLEAIPAWHADRLERQLRWARMKAAK